MKSVEWGLLVLALAVLGGLPLTADGQSPAKERSGEGNPPQKESSAKRDVGKQADSADKSGKVVRTDKEWREMTDKEWREILTPEQFKVLRRKGTERPFRNKYDHHFEPGVYACAACGQELFASETKFNSGCGWPAFYAAKAGDRVKLSPDFSLGMVRTEVTCARCGSHLGHIFNDAPLTPTGQRYCINSAALKFIPAKPGKDADEKPARRPGKSREKGD